MGTACGHSQAGLASCIVDQAGVSCTEIQCHDDISQGSSHTREPHKPCGKAASLGRNPAAASTSCWHLFTDHRKGHVKVVHTCTGGRLHASIGTGKSLEVFSADRQHVSHHG